MRVFGPALDEYNWVTVSLPIVALSCSFGAPPSYLTTKSAGGSLLKRVSERDF
jgi:hypothetical protein